MSIQDKFEGACSIIKEHNAAVGGRDKPGFVDYDTFVACIKASGGTSEDRLKSLSYEDILLCLPQVPGSVTGVVFPQSVKPIALAKDIAKVFRGKEDPQSCLENRPVGAKKADKMGAEELVRAYDPYEPDNPVGKRLKEMSRGEPFVVYSDHANTVDVATTLKLLLEVKKGYTGLSIATVGGENRQVYSVGEKVEAIAEENPLYPGRPLRPDGTCDQTGRSWEGVPLEVRQLVRLALSAGELTVTNEAAHNVLDIVLGKGPMVMLSTRYRKASIMFNELKRTGNLPKLTVPLSGPTKGGSRRPFDGGKRVAWLPTSVVYLNQNGKWQSYSTNKENE